MSPLSFLALLTAGFVLFLLAKAAWERKGKEDALVASARAGSPGNGAHIRVLSAHAHAGDARAQVDLALRYMAGNGVAKDAGKADFWFRQAARVGHPKGLLYIAYRDEQAGDYESAKDHLLQAATLGNAEAMERLGRLYLEAEEQDRDAERGVHFYKLAAESGRRTAQRRYAECLLLGTGVPQDIDAGTLEMQTAADMGDAAAQNIMAEGVDVFIRNRGYSFIARDDGASGFEKPESYWENPSRWNVVPQEMRKSSSTATVSREAPEFLELPQSPRPQLVPQDEKLTLEKAMAQLNGLTGLEEVKSAILSLTNRMHLHRLREQHKLPVAPVSAHMVFTGNPGTGKTTVARLVGNIFREIGILKKGHMIEVSRADLIGEYVGQTGPLVQSKVAEALDGVLFIDEAYSLFDNDPAQGGYGDEAVSTLLKLMEDNRHRLVVVIAGYKDEMNALLLSNPGLSSRFSRVIPFEDFSGYELFRIFEDFATDFGYAFGTEAAETLATVIQKELSEKDIYFGNARFMRQLFDETLNCLANRIARMKKPEKKDLMHIGSADIENAYRTINV